MTRLLASTASVALTAFIAVASAQTDVSGEWELTFNTDQGAISSSLTLKQDGENLTGTLSSPQGEAPVKGTIDGANLKLTLDFSGPNGSMSILMTAEVAGIAMKGEADYGRGSAVFYGKKK